MLVANGNNNNNNNITYFLLLDVPTAIPSAFCSYLFSSSLQPREALTTTAISSF